MRPTIFADDTLDITIWKEEIFGPALCRSPFDTEDEASPWQMIRLMASQIISKLLSRIGTLPLVLVY